MNHVVPPSMPTRALLPLGVLLLFHTASQAQTLDEAEYFRDLPVVITATRLPQKPTELPAAITLIDREMIDASGATEIPDVLRLAAGFQVGHFWGNLTSVTYQGMSDEYARRMQVLIDGRSIYLAETGGVNWSDIPISLADVHHIEVIRGPNGTSFGNNAFLGTIHIFTYRPEEVLGTLVQHTYGDDGLRRTTLRHAEKIDAYQYRVTLERQSDQGYDDYYEPGNRFWQFYDAKASTTLNYRAEYVPQTNDLLTVQLGARSGYQQEGYYGNLTEGPHEDEHKRYFAHVRWARKLLGGNDLEVSLYHIDADYSTVYQTALLSQIFNTTPANILALTGHNDQAINLDRSLHTERYDLELQHRFNPCSGCRFVWGLEARMDRVDGYGYTGTTDVLTNNFSRAFLHSEWRLGAESLLNLGAMYERSDLGGDLVSPRIGLLHNLNREHTVRIGWTRAYRAPVMIEEYADYAARYPDGSVLDQIWWSPGEIDPETISRTEIGLAGQAQSGLWRYDLSLFRSTLRDLISTPTDLAYVEPYSYLCAINGQLHNFCRSTVVGNDASAEAEGIELQAYLHPKPEQLFSLGISRVRAVDHGIRNLNPTDLYDNELTTPETTLSMLMEQGFGAGYRLSIGYYMMSNMLFMGGDETGPISRIDLRLAKRTRLFGKAATLELISRHIGADDFDYIYRIEQKNRTYLRLGMNL